MRLRRVKEEGRMERERRVRGERGREKSRYIERNGGEIEWREGEGDRDRYYEIKACYCCIL